MSRVKNSGAKAPFELQAGDLEATIGTTVILFDVSKQRIVRSETLLQLAGQMTIEIAGEQSHVKMAQKQKTTTVTSDTDPLKALALRKAPASK